MQVYENWR